MRSSEAGLAATRRIAFIAAMMLVAAAGVAAVKPAPTSVATPDIEAMLPEAFGDWRRVPISDAVLPRELRLGAGEAVAYRAYRDNLGRVVTLVAAYGPPLGDSVRLHRPESCYVAQGYVIKSREIGRVELAGVEATLVRLDASGPAHDEAVTYWLRSGSSFVTTGATAQWLILKDGRMSGLDGALVRASSSGRDPALFKIQEEFLKSFSEALSSNARALLIGAPDGDAS